jgi:hypothetical protein
MLRRCRPLFVPLLDPPAVRSSTAYGTQTPLRHTAPLTFRELHFSPIRLTTQERELLRLLSNPPDTLTVVSQFRGARASISARRLERRYGGYHLYWDWRERWLPSLLRVRHVRVGMWKHFEGKSPRDETGFLKTLRAALPLLIAQWTLGAAFSLLAFGAVSGGTAAVAAVMSLGIISRTRVVYIFNNVTVSYDPENPDERLHMQRAVLPQLEAWAGGFNTVLITANEGLPQCFRDTEKRSCSVGTTLSPPTATTLPPATVDEFVATLHRMAANWKGVDISRVDAAFVKKVCAVYGDWHGLSARFWHELPDEFFGPEPTFVLSRDVLLRVAMNLDLNDQSTFRVMALCGSPLVRIADYTAVAAMIAEGDGAGLVEAARDLVGRDEVPRRMLLATLFVADASRRGVVVAATGANETPVLLSRVNDLQCRGSRIDRELSLFNGYVAPLQRALAAVLPATDGFWVMMDEAVFKVTPQENHIDALKEAVKAELESSGRKPTVDQFNMRMAKHDGTPCDDMSAPLVPNTSRTPYGIALAERSAKVTSAAARGNKTATTIADR